MYTLNGDSKIGFPFYTRDGRLSPKTRYTSTTPKPPSWRGYELEQSSLRACSLPQRQHPFHPSSNATTKQCAVARTSSSARAASTMDFAARRATHASTSPVDQQCCAVRQPPVTGSCPSNATLPRKIQPISPTHLSRRRHCGQSCPSAAIIAAPSASPATATASATWTRISQRGHQSDRLRKYHPPQ